MEIINLSVPFKKKPQDRPQIGQPFSPCTEYAIDDVWPLITENTTLDEALTFRSTLYPNLTSRYCSRGIKFLPGIMTLSIAQDFNIVCGYRHYVGTTNSAYMIGMLVGFLISGPLSDNFGRRPVFVCGGLVTYVVGAITAASINIWMFIAMRFLTAAATNMTYVVGCVYLSENVGKNDRNNLGFLRSLQGLIFGRPVLVLLFYLLQQWRWTYLAFCYPIIFVVLAFYAWPESPRWLISQGRVDDCYKTIRVISSCNGRHLRQEELEDLKAKLIKFAKTCQYKGGDETSEDAVEMKPNPGDHHERDEKKYERFTIQKKCLCCRPDFKGVWRRFTLLVCDPKPRLNFFVVIILFFFQVYFFYGITFYTVRNTFNLHPYVTTLVTGALGFPSMLLQWILYRFFDRKWPMTVLYGLTFILLGTASTSNLLGFPNVVVMALTTAALFCLDTLFSLLYIRMPEMFPVAVRTTALGVSGSIARLGGVAASYVEQLDELVWTPLPLLTFSISAIIPFIVSFCMPKGRGEMMDKS